MGKISGSFTIKIADQERADGLYERTVLTIEVTTSSGDDAATVADVLGRELVRLGLAMPDVASRAP